MLDSLLTQNVWVLKSIFQWYHQQLDKDAKKCQLLQQVTSTVVLKQSNTKQRRLVRLLGMVS